MTVSNDQDPIKPTDIAFTPITTGDSKKADSLPWQQQRTTWAALAICVLLALLVIFVLPAMIQPPNTTPVPISSDGPTTVTTESPFRDAQLATARRAAQDVLSKILEKQAFLDGKNVDRWDKETFDKALAIAATGDNHYRQRAFDQAHDAYQTALDQLTALETAIPQRVSDALAAGQAALNNGDAEKATRQFEQAQAIDPDNAEAARGLARAKVLDQVAELVAEAAIARQNNDLSQARTLYRKALELDADHTPAAVGLESVNAEILNNQFNEAMSRGYTALERNQLDSAKAAFNQALQLKPGFPAARSGLTQASSADTKQTLQSLLSEATALESREQWHQARDTYARVMAIDSSVLEARLGQIRSAARAQLDDQIRKILDQPLRLSSDNVRQEAQRILADARVIKSPGTRLQEQIGRLDQTVATATTPVQVELVSDEDTLVTLYRQGELGKFQRKQISLIPGKYVAVGTRRGYRDVRIEFQLGPEGLSQPVVVICEDPIS
ncbi:hypothetical protein [Porticoccus sp.]|uniref:hypothetical protein n=1 Tax=Porticoccus sp. TaxID=2024853 RepID=UPI003F69DDC3